MVIRPSYSTQKSQADRLINITQTYTSSGIPYAFPIDTQMSSKRSKKEGQKAGQIAKQSCKN